MNWTHAFEQLMEEQAQVPYACTATSCSHVSKSTFGQLLHYTFGSHTAHEATAHVPAP
jgi:hypothetical protein